jgi:hypothetical protein
MRRREPGHRSLTAALEDLNAAAARLPHYTQAAIEALSGEMSAIVDALPPSIPPQRLMLFRDVFREWWDLDLQQHRRFFSDASRDVDRARGVELDR